MSDNLESAGSDDYLARLRDLTFHLLDVQETPAKEILVGRLPAQWPPDLPVLEDSRILGSKVPPSGELLVILGTDLPVERVYDVYEATLHAAGWSPLDSDKPFGIREGFGVSARFQHFEYFRADKSTDDQGQVQGWTLRLKANGVPDGSTEVRLYLGRGQPSQPGRSRHRHEYPQVLPLLIAPGGAQLTTSGGGTGEDYRISTAFLQTELDLPSLADFYADHLVKAGWQMNGQESSGPIVWSTWLFRSRQGDAWGGTLLVGDSPGSGDPRPLGSIEGAEDKRDYYLSIYARKL